MVCRRSRGAQKNVSLLVGILCDKAKESGVDISDIIEALYNVDTAEDGLSLVNQAIERILKENFQEENSE